MLKLVYVIPAYVFIFSQCNYVFENSIWYLFKIFGMLSKVLCNYNSMV